MDVAYSINGVPIRLTEERWFHILESKPYMHAYYEDVLRAIEQPTSVVRGYSGSQIAILPIGRNRHLHVVYKELSKHDGFVITAYIARKANRSEILWSRNF